jgi:hypothetical protein
MSFDIFVTQEAQHTRVAVEGSASLGRLLSLLQVLQIDCQYWPHEAVCFDLRGLRGSFTPAQQAQVRAEAERCLPRMKSIVLQWP